MASLDSFLNGAMPIAIIVFFMALIYWKLREPFQAFGGWLKSLFVSASENVPDVRLPTEITYK
jgi:hypothetical protein